MKLELEELKKEIIRLEKEQSDLSNGKHKFGYPKTIDELKDRLTSENHDVESLIFEFSKNKIEEPYCPYIPTLGIYEDDGLYYIFETGDRGSVYIYENGTEEDIAAAFYRRVIKNEIFCLYKEINMQMQGVQKKKN